MGVRALSDIVIDDHLICQSVAKCLNDKYLCVL